MNKVKEYKKGQLLLITSGSYSSATHDTILRVKEDVKIWQDYTGFHVLQDLIDKDILEEVKFDEFWVGERW